MNMKLSHATFLALATTSNMSNAFSTAAVGRSSVSTVVNMVGGWNNDEFLDSLADDKGQSLEEGEKVGDQGGSRFREILQQAKQADREPVPRPIMNPFLAPAYEAPTSSTNTGELSVEEQARLYRELMETGGAPPSKGADLGPPPARFSKTDKAGRPLGRNRDADTIANTADLYFAQLKRDSSVRGMARIRGDQEVAEQVFADEGIKELESLIVENPYLKGLREKEKTFFETVPGEMLKPFFDPDKLPEEERNTSGVSYKEMLEQKRRKEAGHQEATAAPQSIALPAPAPVVQPSAAPVSMETMAPPDARTISQQSTSAMAPPPNPEEKKKKIRTLMGMLLKHRGGPGFGKGRLKGGEIDQFESLLQEVTAMLREEAAQSTESNPGVAIPEMPQQAMTLPVPPQQVNIPSPVPPQQTVVQPLPIALVSPTTPTNFDSTIACIDGAIAMYKNSPPELKSSIMVTLRAALASAINGCDAMIGFQDPGPGVATGQVEGTLGVIEGAVAMYRNSPPELRRSVLFTLRVALKSAVATCDSMSNSQQPLAAAAALAPTVVSQPEAQQAPTPAKMTLPTTPQPLPFASPATDPNSQVLENIYNKMKAAAGDGSLGLRGDLTSNAASELADQLAEMRGILMEELEGGIPESKPKMPSQNALAESSTASNYQQMLAKARAAKAGTA